MRVFSIVVLTGCWVAPAAAPPQVATAPRVAAIEPLVPSPRTEPEPATNRTIERYSNRDLITTHLSRDEVIALDPRRVIPIDVDVRSAARLDLATSDLDLLGGCTRDFVKGQPDTVRRVLLEVFGRYATSCRNGAVTLDRPLGCDSRERRSRTDAALVGPLARRGAGMVLRVSACGSATAFDRVTIQAAGASWTSPRVELVQDSNGCNVAELPLTRPLAEALRATLDQDDAVIQLEGSDTQLPLDDALRDELGAVLAAVDVITAP